MSAEQDWDAGTESVAFQTITIRSEQRAKSLLLEMIVFSIHLEMLLQMILSGAKHSGLLISKILLDVHQQWTMKEELEMESHLQQLFKNLLFHLKKWVYNKFLWILFSI